MEATGAGPGFPHLVIGGRLSVGFTIGGRLPVGLLLRVTIGGRLSVGWLLSVTIGGRLSVGWLLSVTIGGRLSVGWLLNTIRGRIASRNRIESVAEKSKRACAVGCLSAGRGRPAGVAA